MSTDFENAVIAFAQSLDAIDSSDAERRRRRHRLLELLAAEFDGSCFSIAMRRLIHGCEGDWAED